MGIMGLLRVLEVVRTCDANQAQAILWVLLRVNTALLCLNLILAHFDHPFDGSEEIGLMIALYVTSVSPSMV